MQRATPAPSLFARLLLVAASVFSLACANPRVPPADLACDELETLELSCLFVLQQIIHLGIRALQTRLGDIVGNGGRGRLKQTHRHRRREQAGGGANLRGRADSAPRARLRLLQRAGRRAGRRAGGTGANSTAEKMGQLTMAWGVGNASSCASPSPRLRRARMERDSNNRTTLTLDMSDQNAICEIKPMTLHSLTSIEQLGRDGPFSRFL